MKFVIVFVALIALAVAAPESPPAQPPPQAQVLREAVDHVDPTGYKFEYELTDGVVRSEEGVVENAGTDQEAYVVRGTFSYPSPDGKTITLNFVADQNGFQPEGDHIPKA